MPSCCATGSRGVYIESRYMGRYSLVDSRKYFSWLKSFKTLNHFNPLKSFKSFNYTSPTPSHFALIRYRVRVCGRSSYPQEGRSWPSETFFEKVENKCWHWCKPMIYSNHTKQHRTAKQQHDPKRRAVEPSGEVVERRLNGWKVLLDNGANLWYSTQCQQRTAPSRKTLRHRSGRHGASPKVDSSANLEFASIIPTVAVTAPSVTSHLDKFRAIKPHPVVYYRPHTLFCRVG